MARELTVTLTEGVREISAAEWDACAHPQDGRPFDPFTTHRFLSALETSGSVGGNSGWLPRPMVLRADGQIVAVAPLYLKLHSRGEYVFDHGWAEAWMRAGGDYYPKLQLTVPFTPATGRRILARPGWEQPAQSAILHALERIAAQNNLSSAHITFCTKPEVDLAPAPWLPRIGQQFHWQNNGFTSYQDFLATLASRKRKALRKERQTAQEFGGQIVHLTGQSLQPQHWDAFWAFYQDTGARKWGSPYLTRAFFDHIQQSMRDDILLVMAIKDGQPIAGALNFIGRDTLYGRYWGCLEDHPFLHFELCYHQAIDFAIKHGLQTVEAGAQGEHKLARGYAPRPTYSLHHLPNEGFRRAVATFLEEERAAMTEEIALLAEHTPFRKGPLQP